MRTQKRATPRVLPSRFSHGNKVMSPSPSCRGGKKWCARRNGNAAFMRERKGSGGSNIYGVVVVYAQNQHGALASDFRRVR